MTNKRRNQINNVRGLMYQSARLLGDANAVSKGPTAIEKRVVRRVIGREVGKTMWRLLK
jgi:hypothetical protein